MVFLDDLVGSAVVFSLFRREIEVSLVFRYVNCHVVLRELLTHRRPRRKSARLIAIPFYHLYLLLFDFRWLDWLVKSIQAIFLAQCHAVGPYLIPYADGAVHVVEQISLLLLVNPLPASDMLLYLFHLLFIMILELLQLPHFDLKKLVE